MCITIMWLMCITAMCQSVLVMARIFAFANANIRMFFYYSHSQMRIFACFFTIRIRKCEYSHVFFTILIRMCEY